MFRNWKSAAALMVCVSYSIGLPASAQDLMAPQTPEPTIKDELTEKPLTARQAATALGGPTLITLDLNNATPQEFFDALWRQTKLEPFSPHGVAGRKEPLISLNVEQQPFWAVIRSIALQAKVSVDEMGASSDNIRLTPAPGARGLDGVAIQDGPFLVTVSDIERTQKRVTRLNSDQPPPTAEERLQVRFNFFSDPKIPLVPRATTITLTHADTDKGASLLEAQPSVYPVLSNAKHCIETRLYLSPNAADGPTKIARLKGFVRAFIATKTETWEVADINTAQGTTRGVLPEPLSVANVKAGEVAQYKIVSAAPHENGYALELTYLRSRTALENRALAAAIFDRVRLVDEAGNELRVQTGGGRGTFGMSDARNEVLQGYSQRLIARRSAQNAATGPVKMIWEIPVEFGEVEIPFEFTDLPLP